MFTQTHYYLFKVRNFDDYYTNLRQMHSGAIVLDIQENYPLGKSTTRWKKAWYLLNEDTTSSKVRFINTIQDALNEYKWAEENRKLNDEFGLNHNLIHANQYQIQCERDRRKKMQLDAS